MSTQNLKYIINSSSNMMFEGKAFYLHPGFPEKNPDGSYNAETYTQARANSLIIAAEIKKASDLGYKYINLEKGDYAICVAWNDYFLPEGYIHINDVHNVDIDFGGSCIKVIFDSERYNQYCPMHDHAAWNQGSAAIMFYNCTNIVAHNLHMIGECLDRKWIPEENKAERGCGISISNLCKNIYLKNVEGHYFSGDVFMGITSMYPKYEHVFRKWYVDKGLDEKGQLVDVQSKGNIHSLVSELFDFQSNIKVNYGALKFEGPWRDYQKKYSIKGEEKYLQLLITPGTYLYQKDKYAWKIALYVKNQEGILTYKETTLADAFSLIDMDKYDGIRLIVDNDEINFGNDDTSSGIWDHDFHISIGARHTYNVTISDCFIADCHRGGVANMPLRTRIKNSTFYNCGMDCGLGAPLFADSTRYCYDQEEYLTDSVVIEECEFHKGNIGCLINGMKINVSNCTFINAGGVGINTCANAIVSNCYMVGGYVYSVENVVGWRGGKNMKSIVTSINCTINTPTFYLYNVKRRRIEYINCNINADKYDIDNNEDLRFYGCELKMAKKALFYHHSKISGAKLIDTRIYSDDMNELTLSDVEGCFDVENITIHPFSVTGPATIKGLNTINSVVTFYHIDKFPNTIIYFTDCAFNSEVKIIPNSNKEILSYFFRRCEFSMAEYPIHTIEWTAQGNKIYKLRISNCSFKTLRDKIFKKANANPLTLDAQFLNCTAGDETIV